MKIRKFTILVLAISVLTTLDAPAKRKPKKNKPLPVSTVIQMIGQSIDGTENNQVNPTWGSAGIELARNSQANYKDGVSEIDSTLPSARLVSNNIAAQNSSLVNERGLTDMIWQWGQFLDHDIDLTGSASPSEVANILVPTGDSSFDPFSTGTEVISFTRSNYSADSSPRQQINSITSFIDASNVYGSSDTRAAALRTFSGGKLKTTDGDLLPFNEDGLDNAGGTGSNLYLAGDIRANEQVGLLSMHTLWLREHNRVAQHYAQRHPEMTDEELYQMARRNVISEMQAITYNEFLPALLGPRALRPYRAYDATIDASIMNEFSTAAYRFGHSTLSSTILRLDNNGDEIAEGSLSLLNSFFRPDLINSQDDIGYILKGLASKEMQEVDNKVVDDVRNFLFGAPGSGGLDLAALNIQRGRDHGLANYNQARRDWGLDAKNSFSEISSDTALNQALEDTYGDIEKIDLWIGLLAEDHVRGSSVGELMQTILVDQFSRLRDGDKFFYKNLLRGRDLQRIENTRLADVIRRNTQISKIQRNVFFK